MTNRSELLVHANPSSFEPIMRYTREAYAKVVSIEVDSGPSVSLPEQPRYRKRFSLSPQTAEGLHEFFAAHLSSQGDPEARGYGFSILQSNYLCHSLPAALAGEPTEPQQATAWAREISRDYVPLGEGQEIAPGAHGVVRRVEFENPKDQLIHSFVSLGDAVVQVFNRNGNMGITEQLDFLHKEFAFGAPIEIAAPAHAIVDRV